MCPSFLSLHTPGCLSLLSVLSPSLSPLPAESSLPSLNRCRGYFIPGQMALPGGKPPLPHLTGFLTERPGSPVSPQVACAVLEGKSLSLRSVHSQRRTGLGAHRAPRRSRATITGTRGRRAQTCRTKSGSEPRGTVPRGPREPSPFTSRRGADARPGGELEVATAEPGTARTSAAAAPGPGAGAGRGRTLGPRPAGPSPGGRAGGGGDRGGSHTRCARRCPPRGPCPPRRCARPPCGPTG